MQILNKPQKLNQGDVVATISPSWGVAGANDALWKYELGKRRLEGLGLTVVAAPNSMRGEEYLEHNPKARAEDILWAFESNKVKAIIANIGGEHADQVLPYLDAATIRNNPKILLGCSDVMQLHLFCYQAGLSTFYGPNLLTTIAEQAEFQPYSRYWIERVLFNDQLIGEVKPALTYSCDENNHFDPDYIKNYVPEIGYQFIQGTGAVCGRLFGGLTQLLDFPEIGVEDFTDTILFVENIPLCFSPQHLADFLDRLGRMGALQKLSGILIGKPCEYISFDAHKDAVLSIVRDKYGCTELPIIANMNFGHSSPTCILPYGVMAQINCNSKTFTILEQAVI